MGIFYDIQITYPELKAIALKLFQNLYGYISKPLGFQQLKPI